MNDSETRRAVEAAQEIDDMMSWWHHMEERPEDLRAILMEIGSVGTASTPEGQIRRAVTEPSTKSPDKSDKSSPQQSPASEEGAYVADDASSSSSSATIHTSNSMRGTSAGSSIPYGKSSSDASSLCFSLSTCSTPEDVVRRRFQEYMESLERESRSMDRSTSSAESNSTTQQSSGISTAEDQDTTSLSTPDKPIMPSKVPSTSKLWKQVEEAPAQNFREVQLSSYSWRNHELAEQQLRRTILQHIHSLAKRKQYSLWSTRIQQGVETADDEMTRITEGSMESSEQIPLDAATPKSSQEIIADLMSQFSSSTTTSSSVDPSIMDRAVEQSSSSLDTDLRSTGQGSSILESSVSSDTTTNDGDSARNAGRIETQETTTQAENYVRRNTLSHPLQDPQKLWWTHDDEAAVLRSCYNLGSKNPLPDTLSSSHELSVREVSVHEEVETGAESTKRKGGVHEEYLPQWVVRPYGKHDQPSFSEEVESFDEEDQELSHHRTRMEKRNGCKNKVLCRIALFVAAIATVVLMFVVIRGVVTTESSSSSSDGNSTSSSNAAAEFQEMLNLDSSVLDDPDSYQSRALTWLLNDNMFEFYSDRERIQRWVLACIYYSTGGDQTWKSRDGWLSMEPECTWLGVICNSDDLNDHEKTIRGLNLRDVGLTGTFPPETEFLSPTLVLLDLNDNFLDNHGDEGHAFFAKLVNMKYLYVGSNDLTYSNGIPPQLRELSNLVELDASYNRYSGTLNGEIFLNMPFLKVLRLSGNTYNSPIPTEIGQIQSLKYLHLENAALTGDFSFLLEIQMTRIFELWFDKNPNLGGTIPTQIGEVSTLASLSITECSLSGALPSEFGLLSNSLQYLWLSSNQLRGTIPTQLGNLVKLQRMEVWNNDLTGTMPREVCSNTNSPASNNTGVLDILEADCLSEVTCSCCSRCL